jgi:two-component system, chemotaxis family, sensor kinase CheA
MAEFDRSAFIGRFQEEAADLLQRLNEGVIRLEADPADGALLDKMLRDAHTLKGSSRMVGLVEISDIAHRLEDVMVALRDGAIAHTPEMSEHFFDALDTLVHLAEIAGTDASPAVDLAALQERLAAVAETDCEETRDERYEDMPCDEVEESPCVGAGVAGNGSDVVGKHASACDEPLGAKVKQTIRVNTAHVDSILNLISEAVISQVKYEQRVKGLRRAGAGSGEVWRSWVALRDLLESPPSADARGDALRRAEAVATFERRLAAERGSQSSLVTDLAEDLARGNVVVNDLQERGMAMRMLPVGTVFATFPRAMRDLARESKKDVRLVLEGGETELDKKVLEAINDPLIHIMRNAVDHGIEPPGVRTELGKPATGTITVSARPEGDHMIIEVSDDGAGVDTDKVREAAVRKGYITRTEADSMSDREALFLIFEKGFSTSTIITEVSGRGIGMDVVREYIVEMLKGDMNVFSTKGKGTTFQLTIPLTLAIIRALMVRVGGRTYALPTTAIEETLLAEPAEIIELENRQALRRGKRTYPLVRVDDILGVPGGRETAERIPVVTIGFSGHRFGFIVDELVGEQQIVIKPLGNHLRRVENIAGVTILGAGEIVPILNVPDLMANARRGGRRRGVVEGASDAPAGQRTVLICEDSFTTRELERSIFEAAGYAVEVAMDGAEGLGLLRGGLAADAVVTDVQMPRMSGFELTRAIKSDSALVDLPVVIVTSLEREEEKAQGIEAGADAYITKSVFNQDTLLDTVERLIR